MAALTTVRNPLVGGGITYVMEMEKEEETHVEMDV